MKENPYAACRLCARRCGADRTAGETGYCRMGDRAVVARAALHFWEEPPISGTRGSGAIFFCGCSLGCIYCQNRGIARADAGVAIGVPRLAAILSELQAQGAHNVNFVTPTHFVPSVIEAVGMARAAGMTLPVVYNTGSYELPETVDMLAGTVDVFLPDLKYATAKTAAAYSHAKDYPEVARAAIARMVRLAPEPVIDGEGIMRRGVLVRVLLLPEHLAEAKLSVSYLYKTYGDSVYISLMNQYTPPASMPRPLDRPVTRAEYEDLLEYADRIGVKNAFVQESGTQTERFLPRFDGSGVLRPEKKEASPP